MKIPVLDFLGLFRPRFFDPIDGIEKGPEERFDFSGASGPAGRGGWLLDHHRLGPTAAFIWMVALFCAAAGLSGRYHGLPPVGEKSSKTLML